MKYLVTLWIAGFTLPLVGQEVNGLILDSAGRSPVPYANVVNISTRQLAVSSENGQFVLAASRQDTLVFSVVGYKTMAWIVDEGWFTHEKVFALLKDTVFLEEVIISELPPEAVFKQRILAYQPEERFWYHGVPQIQPKEDPLLNGSLLKNPLFAALHPTNYLYYKFSKQEREKRKLYQITRSQPQQIILKEKFTRDWVKEVTKLEGDELTYFIAFCDYEDEYLEKTPLYIIREDLLAKLTQFRQKQSQG